MSAIDPQALGELPLELLERRIEALAAEISSGSARWLELVAEFDRREGWAGSGCRSTCEWVAWRCSLSPRSAREQVRVARAIRELPLIRAEFEAGRLSYSKVRALTRVAEPGNERAESELLELARNATAGQLDRMVRAARRVTAAEADEAARDSYASWFWDDDSGRLVIRAELPADDAAVFLRAVEQAREALAERRAEDAREAREEEADAVRELDPDGVGGSAEPPAPAAPRWPTNAEALAAMADNALAGGGRSLSGGDRHGVVVHIDAETLATDAPGPQLVGSGSCELESGPAIAAETARRLACDASLHGVVERDGRTLDVGRRTRAIPPSIRRALTARDGCCQFPGCERSRFVDAHHIVHWARGGATSLDNLVLLCRHHHRLMHEGGFSVEPHAPGRRIRGRARLRFRRPDGAAIEPSPLPARRAAIGGAERPIGAGPSGQPGPLHAGTGERMHLGDCTAAVLASIDRYRARRGDGSVTG